MTTTTFTLGGHDGVDGACTAWNGENRCVVLLQGPQPFGHENEKRYRHVGQINLQSTAFQMDSPRPGDALLCKLLEQCIDRAAYPRTEITVHTDVAYSHASANADVFNASSLCLMDAAIRMHFYFAAVLVVKPAESADFVVNPPAESLSQAHSVFLFVFKQSLLRPQLIGNCSHGSFEFEDQERALELAQSHALRSLDSVRTVISRKLNKTLNTEA